MSDDESPWAPGILARQWLADNEVYQAFEPYPGEFVVAEDGVWIPGVYASLECCWIAATRCNDADLQRLQDSRNDQAGGSGGVIEIGDLHPIASAPTQVKP